MTEHHLSINGDTVMLVLCEMGPDRYGDAGPVDSVVRVDSSLAGKEFTDTLIHEMLHIAVPMASEAWSYDSEFWFELCHQSLHLQ